MFSLLSIAGVCVNFHDPREGLIKNAFLNDYEVVSGLRRIYRLQKD